MDSLLQMQYKIETRQIALLHFQQVDLCQASPEKSGHSHSDYTHSAKVPFL